MPVSVQGHLKVEASEIKTSLVGLIHAYCWVVAGLVCPSHFIHEFKERKAFWRVVERRCNRYARSDGRAQWTEERPQVLDQQFGFLHCREMPAPGHFCPALHVIDTLSPLPREGVICQIFREHRYRAWHFNELPLVKGLRSSST